MVGAGSYDQIRNSYKGWAEEYLEKGAKTHQDERTCSIAVGNKPFVKNVKSLSGFRAEGREIKEGDKGYPLRRGSAPYKAFFGVENDDIGLENTYVWNVNPE